MNGRSGNPHHAHFPVVGALSTACHMARTVSVVDALSCDMEFPGFDSRQGTHNQHSQVGGAMKTAAQILSELLDALSGVDDDGPDYRSVRKAKKLAEEALAIVSPA